MVYSCFHYRVLCFVVFIRGAFDGEHAEAAGNLIICTVLLLGCLEKEEQIEYLVALRCSCC